MKAYTDISQSKILKDILPIESADMYFEPSAGFCTEPSEVKVGDIKYAHPRSVPCWSLAALLNVLPPKYYQIKDHETNLILGKPKDKWCALYWDATGMQDGEQTLGDSPVDACVAMIEKLHEQNLL